MCKVLHVHSVEYYSALKGEIVTQATPWMKLTLCRANNPVPRGPRRVRSSETRSRVRLGPGGGEGSCLMGTELLWDDKSVLEMMVVMVTQHHECT